jgi:energy-converting hydrogenase Eha subunit E
MVDEAVWKKRFLLFMAARLLGLLTFLAGLAVAFSDVFREGGWPQVGAILIILGAIDAVFAPRLLKKQWDREDAPNE